MRNWRPFASNEPSFMANGTIRSSRDHHQVFVQIILRQCLPPGALARRQVAGLRVEARGRAAVVPDALERPEGTAHHRPQEGARRDVALLAAPRRAVTHGRLTNALS